MAGKVTIPIAKAMGILTTAGERRKLWEAVKAKPQDPEEVGRIIAELESMGAINVCVEQATNLVEDAWKKLDRETVNSQAKLMLRAFGWFIVER